MKLQTLIQTMKAQFSEYMLKRAALKLYRSMSPAQVRVLRSTGHVLQRFTEVHTELRDVLDTRAIALHSLQSSLEALRATYTGTATLRCMELIKLISEQYTLSEIHSELRAQLQILIQNPECIDVQSFVQAYNDITKRCADSQEAYVLCLEAAKALSAHTQKEFQNNLK